MNNKGFLLGEFTLKMVIAILSILLLVYLLFGIYGTFSEKNKLAKAESTLVEVVERVELAGSNSQDYDFIMTGPNGWSLVAFLNNGPEACLGNQCLCICDGGNRDKCDRLGSCEKVSSEFENFEAIKIDGPTGLFIKKTEGKIAISKNG
ncbi:hypothetical protein AUJ84_00935 [Candidatus Pacearchaeota archaeon CG1_02_32_132]|nr:MAG: hypothetical protein AUJ84_00935 [Candidatus Pacearchaeota archaeon CG1_02_32_132]